MSTIYYRGGARKTAQVQTFAFAGTWEADDVIRCEFANGKRVDFTAGSTTTATVVSNLVTAWNALDATDFPEFAEITASANSTTFTLTADTAGVPFTVTLTPLEVGLGAADSQTIEGAGTATTGTAATANSGPADASVAANWSGGATPVDNDVIIIENYDGDILYGLTFSGIDPTTVHIMASFTGQIGLPRTNESGGYPEYRTQYLTFNSIGTLNIGAGEGQGSGRIKINAGTNAACTATVYKTGSPEEDGIPAVLLTNTKTSTVLEVQGGSVGYSIFASESGTVTTCNVTDGTLWVGSGATLTTLNQGGGEVTLEGAVTTWNRTDGVGTIRAGAITTLNNRGGTVNLLSSGTITTYNGGPKGTLDASGDLTARTITNCNIYAGTTIKDPFGKITFSNGLITKECRVQDFDWDVGYSRTLTPS